MFDIKINVRNSWMQRRKFPGIFILWFFYMNARWFFEINGCGLVKRWEVTVNSFDFFGGFFKGHRFAFFDGLWTTCKCVLLDFVVMECDLEVFFGKLKWSLIDDNSAVNLLRWWFQEVSNFKGKICLQGVRQRVLKNQFFTNLLL